MFPNPKHSYYSLSYITDEDLLDLLDSKGELIEGFEVKDPDLLLKIKKEFQKGEQLSISIKEFADERMVFGYKLDK